MSGITIKFNARTAVWLGVAGYWVLGYLFLNSLWMNWTTGLIVALTLLDIAFSLRRMAAAQRKRPETEERP